MRKANPDKKDLTRILLTLPISLQETLKAEAKEDNRALNNYIITLLLARKKGK